MGIDGEQEALVLKGLYSGLTCIYPVQAKDHQDTIQAFGHYRGRGEIRRLYSGSAELNASRRALTICHEASQPGMPQNNGIIERANQDIKLGASACLLQAGHSGQFWPPRGPLLLPLG